MRAGSGVYYEPDAGIRHDHRTRLMALLRRRADYGSSEADLQQRHEEARRTMMVPVVGTTWLTALMMLPVAWPVSLGLALFGALVVCIEFGRKMRQLRDVGVQLPARSILTAISRQHGAGLYHLGANVTRYYSFSLLAVSLFWPPLLLTLFVLLLLPPVVDHRRLRPKLGLITFVCLYSLELMAYQVGVWRGCLKRRTLRPLLAKLCFSR